MANHALHLRHAAYIVHAGLHARMEFNFLQPLAIGMRVRSRGRVIDKYSRRGKPCMMVRDQDGQKNAVGIASGLLLEEQP